jgi:cobalt-zinc-cadmium efflux system outer membrane protein
MTISRVGLLPACLLLALACVDPTYAGGPLTLGAAQERAAANPALAAAAAELDAVRARATRDGLAPPLVLGTELENVAGNGEFRGLDAAELTVQISRPLELGGKRAARRMLGAATVARAELGLGISRLELRSQVSQRFAAVVAAQAQRRLAEERTRMAQRTREEVRRVVESARNPETDLRAAEIALANAELEQQWAAQQLRVARVMLAGTWGAREPDFDEALMPIESLAPLPDLAALAAGLPASASLQSLAADAQTAVARERLARSESRPDLNLSLGVRRLEAFGEQALVMGVSLPLGTAARARLAQAEARAEATAAARRRDAVELEAHQQLFERFQELAQADQEFRTLRDAMIPTAEKALALAERGFEAGRFSFTALAQAQETLFELRRRRIEAAERHHLLLADIQRLTGAAEAP